jgi:hypothetical protein
MAWSLSAELLLDSELLRDKMAIFPEFLQPAQASPARLCLTFTPYLLLPFQPGVPRPSVPSASTIQSPLY